MCKQSDEYLKFFFFIQQLVSMISAVDSDVKRNILPGICILFEADDESDHKQTSFNYMNQFNSMTYSIKPLMDSNTAAIVQKTKQTSKIFIDLLKQVAQNNKRKFMEDFTILAEVLFPNEL